MKRQYIKPTIKWFSIIQQELLTASGPGANDQNNPGLSGGSSRGILWDDEDEE